VSWSDALVSSWRWIVSWMADRSTPPMPSSRPSRYWMNDSWAALPVGRGPRSAITLLPARSSVADANDDASTVVGHSSSAVASGVAATPMEPSTIRHAANVMPLLRRAMVPLLALT
jgi:hypothetical protein